jgi:thiol-disulfide isomerase/thioredoxin
MGRASVIVLVLGIVAGCSSGDSYRVTIDPHGQKILAGRIFPSMLESDSSFQWYRKNYDSFTPDSTSIVFLSSTAKNIHFIVFGGTWCSDTKRELPKFFKTMSLAGIPQANIEMYGVDRSKRSSDGMTDTYNITSVPTFIVIADGKEIGRIVEQPEESIEIDLKRIVEKK